MRVENATKGFTICEDAELLDTAEGRRRGLSGQGRKDAVLEVAWGSRLLSMIHMAGMRYPLDVVWVGQDLKAVDVRRGIPPFRLSDPKTWRMYMPKKPAKYVVEIGKGDVGDTQPGDWIIIT